MKYKKILSIIVMLAAVGISGLYLFNRSNQPEISQDRAPNSVDYGKPTKEEVSAGDTQKEANANRKSIDQTDSRATDAEIIIVDFSRYDSVVELRAYISNKYEDGGTCTATIKLDDLVVRKTSTAFKDATTTQCGTIEIPSSEFTKSGSWDLELTYESSASYGKVNKSIKI